MALPPTIPTSFVPRPSSTGAQRVGTDFRGIFPALAYGVLVLTLALAIGVFIYGRILATEQSSKDANLAKAEAAIDPATVQTFVRLRDRLSYGTRLLDAHPVFSSVFTGLETLLPSATRLSSLHLSLDTSGVAKLEGSGFAKSFNALAAASVALAKDGRIRDVIFSGISVNQDNSVSFALAATLDPKIVAFTPAPKTATTTSSATP